MAELVALQKGLRTGPASLYPSAVMIQISGDTGTVSCSSGLVKSRGTTVQWVSYSGYRGDSCKEIYSGGAMHLYLITSTVHGEKFLCHTTGI